MSKRLQVLLDEADFKRLKRVARGQKMTVAEWVRQAIRAAWRTEPSKDVQRKLEVIRKAAEHSFPAADIEQMLAEIEQGYLGGVWGGDASGSGGADGGPG